MTTRLNEPNLYYNQKWQAILLALWLNKMPILKANPRTKTTEVQPQIGSVRQFLLLFRLDRVFHYWVYHSWCKKWCVAPVIKDERGKPVSLQRANYFNEVGWEWMTLHLLHLWRPFFKWEQLSRDVPRLQTWVPCDEQHRRTEYRNQSHYCSTMWQVVVT